MSRRRKQTCLLIIFFVPTLFFVCILHNAIPPKAKARFPVGPRQGYNAFVTTFPPLENSSAAAKVGGEAKPVPLKTILLWTEFFGSKEWLATPDTFQSCAVKTCRLVTQKERVGEADAVMMNVRDIYSPADLPPHHPPHQIWIVHGSEPPYYIYIHLEQFNNVFNWTSWYRTDADIFSPYGHFTPVGPVRDLKLPPNDSQHPYHHPHHHSGTQPPNPEAPDAAAIFQPNHLDKDFLLLLKSQPSRAFQMTLAAGEEEAAEAAAAGEEDPYSLHDLLVFWAASSCINYSQRLKLVRALQKHLPVDTYGSCGSKKCGKGVRACEELLARYKFVLAFENGYCRDYVTEKYWNAISRSQIPIVSGGADYSSITIPGSYIDVDDFASVPELAAFILRVASERELYNSFFQWRAGYSRLSPQVCNWCQLCAALHTHSRLPQVYSDFKGWVADDTCPVHSTFLPYRWLLQHISFKYLGI